MAFLTVHFAGKEPLKLKIETPCNAFEAYNEACKLCGVAPRTKNCANGTCGKCRAKIRGSLSEQTETEKLKLSPAEKSDGIRLLCQTEILGDAELFVDSVTENMQIEAGISSRLLSCISEDSDYSGFGVAVDLGTTTIAGLLFKAGSGAPLSSAVMPNPQRSYGTDVITRISASLEGHAGGLFQLVCGAIDKLIEELCRKAGAAASDVGRVCISANTTMLYLLTEKDCSSISKSPFNADCLFGFSLEAGNLNGKSGGLKAVNASVPVYHLPCVSAFIGADTVSCILSLNIEENAQPAVIADMGTNSEMVLFVPAENGKPSEIICTSSAAGPAFEGANISCGMSAVDGAAENISLVNGKAEFSVVGGATPSGLCGSGLLDAVAVLRQTGQLDEAGAIVFSDDSDDEEGLFETLEDGGGAKAVLYKDASTEISLLQSDIRAFQLAKASLCAGLECLIKSAGIAAGSIERLYLAGGFAKSFSVQNAVNVGLFPDGMAQNVQYCGNASLMGAALVLQDKTAATRASAIAQKATLQNLAGTKQFQDLFLKCMALKVQKL
ncbi:MAG: DUF4445 domain-containing protein [Spirochaetaceae bacterium]|nr:DUF4445 domain-containing protein [Spirochaetaceae bacterium]